MEWKLSQGEIMKLIFVGPQGSGKGTQAKIIAKKLSLVHVSTGDLVRETTGDLKKEVDNYINKGRLVPDPLIIRLLEQKLKEIGDKGIILDGFPRNLNQAEELDKIIKIDKIIEISISDKEAIKRLGGRWNCKKCGIAYNVVTAPRPKNGHLCDNCDIGLYQRKDDIDKEAIMKRLNIYHNETEPILKKYSSVKINGKQAIEKVTEDVLKELGA